MPFLQLGKKSATKAGLGEHFDNLTQDLLALPAPTSGVAGTGHTLAMPAQTQSTADDLFTKQFGKSYQQATPQEMAQFIQSLKALPSPKSITTPNTQGTPNPIYSTGGIQQGEVGGMRQRIAK